MLRRISKLGAVAALATAVLMPAEAGATTLVCSSPYLNPYALNLPGYANCMVDWSIDEANDALACTRDYDPLSPPLGANAVPETQDYATCLRT